VLRRIAAVLLLLVTLAARGARAAIVVRAPPSLSAYADRIGRMDRAALAHALASAGLELPPEIRVALVSETETGARAVPRWIAGLAWGDRDIVIFPERVLSYPYDSLESVVRHEVTHLALDARAGGAPLPRWFHEGVATSVDAGWKMSARLQLLLAMLGRPDTTELARLFASATESDTTRAYLLSAVLVQDLRERHGAAMPGAVARRVASGMSFDEAFKAETGSSPDAAADAAWAAYRRWTAWTPLVTSPSAAWTLILVLAVVAFVAQRRRRARRRAQWAEEEQSRSTER
jgi:hypothetical protein